MRILRFRVRTLMIAVAVVAVVAASVTWRLREIERQRRLAELLARIHVDVDYGDLFTAARLREMERERRIAELLRHYHGPYVDGLALERFRAGTRVPVPHPARAPEAIRNPEPD